MKNVISKSKFKAHSLAIFRYVERTGESVVITDRGIPKLTLDKYTAGAINARERLKGSVLHYHAPTEPVDKDTWNALA